MPKDEEIRQLLADPALSDWFKRALRSALERDPDRRLRAEAERQRLAHRKLDEALRLKSWSSGKTEKIGR